MKLSERNRNAFELRKPKPAIAITVTSGIINHKRAREICIWLKVVSTPVFITKSLKIFDKDRKDIRNISSPNAIDVV